MDLGRQPYPPTAPTVRSALLTFVSRQYVVASFCSEPGYSNYPLPVRLPPAPAVPNKAVLAVLGLCAGLMLTGAHSASAQTLGVDSTRADSSVARADAAPPMFSHKDLHVLEEFGVAAAAAFPLDEWINREAQTSALHGRDTRYLTLDLGAVAFPGVYYAAYGLYGLGLLTSRERVLDAGWHTLASVIIATHTGELVKAAFGRARPSASTDAERFAWAKPLRHSERYSFPSGHATAAFAAASALSEELSRTAPRAARIIDPMVYTLAGVVGVSRVYGEAHWASDVVAGAALGTFTSRAVVRLAHAHRQNLVDRVMVHAVVTADNAGRTLLGFSGTP